MSDRHDVAILGGGLAGLTLALQLKRTRPETSVLVLEKRKGPAPLAAFKVGESTLEIAGHYFADVCGLRDHLDSDHLWKLGLRYYFPAGDNRDIARRVEWGPPAPRREIPFRIKTYQIDRGLFENELAERCRANGVDLRDGSPVQDVEFGEGDADHRITYAVDGEEKEATARWVVGATGRAAFLKRKLGLAKDVEHTINSSWLRLQGGLNIDDWSDDEGWHARMQQQKVRWLYTNHLMGEGYWVWLIPLSTGAISIGIVADPRFHPFEQINSLEAALEWLDAHEPLVADAVRARPDDVQDFLRIENYAYQVERVYSPERWCLTGDAGAFTDPFYSPGSDFIALGNGCITDLVMRDLAGEPIQERVEQFNTQFLEQFERQLDFYTGMYELWGNPQVMCAKVSWDLLVYWGLTSVRYVHGLWHDPDFTAEVSDLLDRGYGLNVRIQRFFREWHAIDDREAEDAYIALIPFAAVGLRRLDLERPVDAEGLKALLAQNVERMEGMAVAMFNKAAERLPDAGAVQGRAVNPYAIGLDPSRWEEDGLFDGPGLTHEQALERAEGIQSIWLDELAGAPSPGFAKPF
ncbi:MAG: tryptophan 7-halogenase [Actinobacteria bacterium]|nr:tryptophan 7-halogenase [Actinomycetota bacterium]